MAQFSFFRSNRKSDLCVPKFVPGNKKNCLHKSSNDVSHCPQRGPVLTAAYHQTDESLPSMSRNDIWQCVTTSVKMSIG